jgi:hypothetical protein
MRSDASSFGRPLDEPNLRHEFRLHPTAVTPPPQRSIGPPSRRRLIATAARGGQPLEVERVSRIPAFQVSGLHLRPQRRACRGGAAPTRSRHAPVRRGPGVRACRGVGGGAWPPHGARPRTTPRTRSGAPAGPAECRGGRRRGGRTARGSGNVEIWNPESLRGCSVVAGFQIFRFSPPRPPGPRWRPSGGVKRPRVGATCYREARQKFLTAWTPPAQRLPAGCCRDLRVEEPRHFTATSQRLAEISFSQPSRDE